MTPDAYLNSVLARHHNATSVLQAQAVILTLQPHINVWGGSYLVGVNPSGSIAKGTAITGTSDVDLLVSVRSDTPDTLKQIYESLHQRFATAGYAPRKQNVSIGLNVNGLKVDVVPAKKQGPLTNDHSLWSHKHQTWRQTNIHKHIQLIVNSGRSSEIKALKVWRKVHNLELPSFPAEMFVLQALKGRPFTTPATNFLSVLEYIRDNVTSTRILDPSNSNNVVTDDLTSAEKQALRTQAQSSLLEPYWEQILW